MSWEELWYSSYRNGRRPAIIRRLPRCIVDDPSAALRLALAIHVNASGYRSTGDARWPGDPVYFWDRPDGRWWSIPRDFEAAARAEINGAIDAATVRGIAHQDAVTAVLERRLADAGEPVSILDARITPALFDGAGVPARIRRRIAMLLAERNTCDDSVVPAISCRLIELARGYAAQ